MWRMNRTGASSFRAPSSPSEIRNVVLVGPQGTGKSALLAQLTSGQLGHVKDAEEASTALGVASTVHEGTGTVVTVVDTPGRPDFVGDVRAGLRAADAVVFVVAAGSGIDEATRMLWRECEGVGVPRLIAVTQLELARADFDSVVAQCRRVFGAAVPLAVPVVEGQELTGIVELLDEVRHEADGTTRSLTDDERAEIETQRGELVEAIIETSEDETLLDRYLSGEELDREALRTDLRAAISTARFFPIVVVNPPTGMGVTRLLDIVVNAFPSPDQAWLPTVTDPAGEELLEISADPAGPLVSQVVRTTTDPYVGRLSLVRIFSGTLSSGDHLHVSGHLERVLGRELPGHPGHDEDDERVGQIMTPVPGATSTVPRDSAIAGELVLVTKLASAETADTLSDTDRPALAEPWLLPEPLLPVAIRATASKDEDKLAGALQRLLSEDVTLRLEHNAETHQVVLWTLGPAQVDDVLEQLRSRYNVAVETEPVKTSLRETFVRKVQVQGRLVKQSGGHGQYAVVQLEIEPLERGAGFEFVDKVVGGAVPRQFIPSVEKGVRNQLAEGVLAGYPCVDVRVTLRDGKAHSVDSSDMAFQTAAGMALREAANESTVSLLEPVDAVEITVADEYVGAVMADLRGRRAQVYGTEPVGDGHTVVRAEVPEHELARYPIDLRSISHGSGTFTRSFARYDYLPAALARELTG
ncbi:elongation factor G-like protein EF-G2 [Ornithinimicrobium humiphilum]